MPNPTKTLAALKSAICAYMNRQENTFVVNGGNNLLIAINNAKDFIQRAIDFEYTKVYIQLTNVDITLGGNLDNAVLFSDPTVAVDVKKVTMGWLPFIDGNGQAPAPIISRREWAQRRLRIAQEFTSYRLNEARPLLAATGFALVLDGKSVFVDPQTPQVYGGLTTLNLFFDAIKWIEDFNDPVIGAATATTSGKLVDSAAGFTITTHAGDTVLNQATGVTATVSTVDSLTQLTLSANIFTSGQAYQIIHITDPDQQLSVGVVNGVPVASVTHFMFNYAFDLLLFRSLKELNFFLKEDERVQISDTVYMEVWNNVVNWNATIVNNTVDISLD